MNINTMDNKIYTIKRAVREPSSPNQRPGLDDSAGAKFLPHTRAIRHRYLTRYVLYMLVKFGG
jgi:hypothetical protein